MTAPDRPTGELSDAALDATGYMIAGRTAMQGPGLVADWDGVVHPTRAAAEVELMACQRAGFTDWQLYALMPVPASTTVTSDPDRPDARAQAAARLSAVAVLDDTAPTPDARQAVLDRQRGELGWLREIRRAALRLQRAALGPGEGDALDALGRALDTPRPDVEAARWSARPDGSCVRCDSAGPHVALTSCGSCGATWLSAAEVAALRDEIERVHSALRHESDAHIAERDRLRATAGVHSRLLVDALVLVDDLLAPWAPGPSDELATLWYRPLLATVTGWRRRRDELGARGAPAGSPTVLGVALPGSADLVPQIGLIERLSEALYVAGRRLRRRDLVFAGAALQDAALCLVHAADHHRDALRAGAPAAASTLIDPPIERRTP